MSKNIGIDVAAAMNGIMQSSEHRSVFAKPTVSFVKNASDDSDSDLNDLLDKLKATCKDGDKAECKSLCAKICKLCGDDGEEDKSDANDSDKDSDCYANVIYDLVSMGDRLEDLRFPKSSIAATKTLAILVSEAQDPFGGAGPEGMDELDEDFLGEGKGISTSFEDLPTGGMSIDTGSGRVNRTDQMSNQFKSDSVGGTQTAPSVDSKDPMAAGQSGRDSYNFDEFFDKNPADDDPKTEEEKRKELDDFKNLHKGLLDKNPADDDPKTDEEKRKELDDFKNLHKNLGESAEGKKKDNVDDSDADDGRDAVARALKAGEGIAPQHLENVPGYGDSNSADDDIDLKDLLGDADIEEGSMLGDTDIEEGSDNLQEKIDEINNDDSMSPEDKVYAISLLSDNVKSFDDMPKQRGGPHWRETPEQEAIDDPDFGFIDNDLDEVVEAGVREYRGLMKRYASKKKKSLKISNANELEQADLDEAAGVTDSEMHRAWRESNPLPKNRDVGSYSELQFGDSEEDERSRLEHETSYLSFDENEEFLDAETGKKHSLKELIDMDESETGDKKYFRVKGMKGAFEDPVERDTWTVNELKGYLDRATKDDEDKDSELDWMTPDDIER